MTHRTPDNAHRPSFRSHPRAAHRRRSDGALLLLLAVPLLLVAGPTAPARAVETDVEQPRWCAPLCATLSQAFLDRHAETFQADEVAYFRDLASGSDGELTADAVRRAFAHALDFSLHDLIAAGLFAAGHEELAVEFDTAPPMQWKSDHAYRALFLRLSEGYAETGHPIFPAAYHLTKVFVTSYGLRDDEGPPPTALLLPAVQIWDDGDMDGDRAPFALSTESTWDDTDIVHLLADGMAAMALDVVPHGDDGQPEPEGVRSVWFWEHGWTLQSNCVLEQSDNSWCNGQCRDDGFGSGTAKEAIPGLFGGCAGVLCSCVCMGSPHCDEGDVIETPYPQF